MDKYHDRNGERIRLDTRHLEACSRHQRESVEEQERRMREANFAYLLLRSVASVFCGVFVFNHIRTLLINGAVIVESLGVIACLAFIGVTIADFMEVGRNG